MIKKLFIFFIILLFSGNLFAQQVTRDELPNTNSTDSTAVLNNILRQNQNAINSIGGYFNSNGYLSTSSGGTGVNSSNWPAGDIVYMSSTGTWGHEPIGHGVQVFLTSGTFTAPAGDTQVVITLVGGGGQGGSGASGGSGGGGAGGGQAINQYIPVVGGNSYTVTVGAGGSSGSGSSTGQTGGTTCFDVNCVDGGGGGQGNSGGGGSSGGSSPGGLGATTGSPGLSYIPSGNGSGNIADSVGGNGGGTIQGRGALGAQTSPQAGSSASDNTGAGGGGGANGTGGSGGSGICIVQY